MKKHLFGAALVVCLVAMSSMAMAQTIDEIQYYNPATGAPESPYVGQQVTVSGSIYVVKGTYNSGTHYMQGPTGAMGLHTVLYKGHWRGILTPVRTSPQAHPLGSGTGFSRISNTLTASKAA